MPQLSTCFDRQEVYGVYKKLWLRGIMSLAPKHPCPTPGCTVLLAQGRQCSIHAPIYTRHQRGYTNDWLRLVRIAIKEQPWCASCGAQHDLTGDHITPLSAGGMSTLDNVQVLCRSCNSRKGAA